MARNLYETKTSLAYRLGQLNSVTQTSRELVQVGQLSIFQLFGPGWFDRKSKKIQSHHIPESKFWI